MTRRTDEQLSICYFEKNLECPDRADCPIGRECLSLAREEMEARHYHLENISVPHLVFDPVEEESSSVDAATKTFYSAIDESSEPEPDLCLKEISVPAESLPFIYKVLERIAKFYFTMPNVFQQLMNAIYHGKSQSDIAREKKISRQLANKRLMKEIGMLQKKREDKKRHEKELAETTEKFEKEIEELRAQNDFMKSLSDPEIRVYKLIWVDKLSIRKAASVLGMSRMMVYRLGQRLASKTNDYGTLSGLK